MRMVFAIWWVMCGLAPLVLAPATASAQTTRTFVSGVGDDANPCSRTAPCRTFAGALSKTIDGGVINILDAANYGVVTVTKAITLRAEGAEGAISAFSSGTAVIVNAPDRQVNLIGLNIDGLGAGAIGVRVVAAQQVHIEDCRIFNHRTGAGTGLSVAAAAETRVMLRRTTISGNLIGVDVAPAGSQPNTVVFDDVMLDANPTANLRADQSRARVTIRRSTILGSPVVISNGAQLRSFGDNALTGATPTRADPLR